MHACMGTGQNAYRSALAGWFCPPARSNTTLKMGEGGSGIARQGHARCVIYTGGRGGRISWKLEACRERAELGARMERQRATEGSCRP